MVYCYKVLNCARIYDSLYYFLCYVYAFVYLLCSFLYIQDCFCMYMYNEYTVSIFRFLKLFLHDSKCFSPAVYLNVLFFGEQKFL
jgi:hypothetical protein